MMSYTTANTEWPSAIAVSAATKAVIDTYFNLLDTNSREVGDRLAREIFTEDGVIIGPTGEIKGTEGMSTLATERPEILFLVESIPRAQVFGWPASSTISPYCLIENIDLENVATFKLG
jgi:hypothetical protein